jgi:dihydrolipoamide dehydrogenase
MSTMTIKVPDIGDFEQVEVIEILVAIGDTVKLEDSLITVESDKASMEIPSPQAGIVKSISVQMGDRISEGGNILEMELTEIVEDAVINKPLSPEKLSEKENAVDAIKDENINKPAANNAETDLHAEVLVLGAGPGGYTAAFRAADLGKKVILVEKFDSLGGVCLNVGCIPSKALLHVAEVMEEAKEFSQLGVSFNQPKIDTDQLRKHKNKVVGKLTGGLKQLAKQRKVKVVNGYGKFSSSHSITVTTSEGSNQDIAFDHCIISVGSSVFKLPTVPWDDERVWDSTDALEIKTIPKRLLIVGAGIIGLEMATVYHALGSKITIVGPQILPGVDRDLLRAFERTLKKRYENIFIKTRLTGITATDDGLVCQFNGDKAPEQDTFDNVLIAIGRTPNGKLIDAEKAGVAIDEKGFITVDSQMRTNVDHIFAIGDVVGQPMLAHKATHEAKVAAEVIAGFKRHFDARTIPSVAYTSPEVAWCGQTEEELKADGIEYEKGVFPWAASGRALSMGAEMGITKVLYDKKTQQMLGTGIVGKNAGELIAEATLAVEMGAEIEDVALTIHPHPTLSETINFASEIVEGSCTDIYAPKK